VQPFSLYPLDMVVLSSFVELDQHKLPSIVSNVPSIYNRQARHQGVEYQNVQNNIPSGLSLFLSEFQLLFHTPQSIDLSQLGT
jgi:hypothetical protein